MAKELTTEGGTYDRIWLDTGSMTSTNAKINNLNLSVSTEFCNLYKLYSDESRHFTCLTFLCNNCLHNSEPIVPPAPVTNTTLLFNFIKLL